MLPFILARKYLVPRRKNRMLSFIGVLSLLVITCIVFLLLVFFSVTEGIEERWLSKLTTLHSPIRLIPTQDYYDSLYYKIDTISASSDYTPKSIREKTQAHEILPSDHEPIPSYWKTEDNTKKDIVKETFSVLNKLELKGAPFQATTGLAELRTAGQKTVSFPCYLSTPPALTSLKSILHAEDPCKYFSFLSSLKIRNEDDATFINRWNSIFFDAVSVHSLRPHHSVWKLPRSFFSSDQTFVGWIENGRITLPINKKHLPVHASLGTIAFKNNQVYFNDQHTSASVYLSGEFTFNVTPQNFMHVQVQNKMLQGEIQGKGLFLDQYINKKKPEDAIADAFFADHHLEHSQKGCALLAPKHLLSQGVTLGNTGSFLYYSMGLGGMQQLHIPFFISGFYDPGLLPIGMKALLVHPQVIESIAHNNDSQAQDPLGAEGIAVHTASLDHINQTTEEIKKNLSEANLSIYWDVVPFSEYESTKELFQQFQSDKLLILLISCLLLICASTNIIALLFILVKEKTKEIALLKTLGATTKQVTSTFCIVGLTLSLIGLVSGTFLAYLALNNLPLLLKGCSILFNQELLQSSFFGTDTIFPMSSFALKLVFVITPIFALIATLVPALSASRVQPAQLLRS